VPVRKKGGNVGIVRKNQSLSAKGKRRGTEGSNCRDGAEGKHYVDLKRRDLRKDNWRRGTSKGVTQRITMSKAVPSEIVGASKMKRTRGKKR